MRKLDPNDPGDPVDIRAACERITERLAALPKCDAQSLRSLSRELAPGLAAASARGVIDLAVALFHSKAPGSHVIAYELIRRHGSAPSGLRERDLRRLGARMSSWARSRSRWWRRAALVSTVPLNVRAQGGHGDAPRTLAICEVLADDRDPMLVKAMSWALRALAVRDAEAVRAFMARNGHRLSALVVREVRNKLRTGRKAGTPVRPTPRPRR